MTPGATREKEGDVGQTLTGEQDKGGANNSPTGAGNQRSLAEGENDCRQGILRNTIHSRVKQYIITKKDGLNDSARLMSSGISLPTPL